MIVGLEEERQPDAAISALERVSSRDDSEVVRLGHLYVTHGHFDRLAKLEGLVELFDHESLVIAAQGLAGAGLFDESRAYFERALSDPLLQARTWEGA